jgi:TonB family protein
MKSCPRCGKQYPDTEVFCETDGTALAAVGSPAADVRATTVMAPGDNEASEGSTPVECPVCGGKAQPGEIICNFCGTRLAPEAPVAAPSPGAAGTRLSPESFVPARDRIGPQEMGGEAPADAVEEGEAGGRRLFSVLGFSIAAILALIAGAWLALYLSSRPSGTPPLVQASPSVSPSPAVVSGPIVELAKTLAIQVSGDSAAAPSRGKETLNRIFDSNKTSLADAYKRALDSDSALRDGMVVRLHVLPDGSVTDASVRVSTMSNPSVLDADVVKAVRGWKLAPATGAGADVDYPLIFATSPSELSGLESDLHTKLAALGPNEAPEYSSAPPSPTPAEAAATPSAPPETPGIAAVPPTPGVIAPEPSPAPSPRRRRPPSGGIASAPTPKISLGTRVTGELHANRKFRRVSAYTSGSIVTLVGKVFDDHDKLLAARTAREVSGVTAVVNDLATDEQEWLQKQARIQAELQNAGLEGVTAKVIGNDAYLSGDVKTALDRDRAVTVAQAAARVTVRTNLIRVAPGSVFGF